MCELFALSSRHPTSVAFSLQRFARRGGLNGKTLDGWGLAYYEGRDLHLLREPKPARDSAWLGFIEARQSPSGLVMSHIRQATRGAVALANTQPFAREIAGRMHCFAHNGMLAGIDRDPCFQIQRFNPIGETDSEVAACTLFDRMAALWAAQEPPDVRRRTCAVRQFAADLRRLGPANFVYSDGEVLIAHGHRRTQADGTIAPPGLWYLHRQCAADPQALADSGVRVAVSSAGQEVTLFASVPLTDEPWKAVAEGKLVVAANGVIVVSEGEYA